MPSANGIRTSVLINKRVYSVEKRENDRVYSLLYLEGKRLSYILSRTHLTLYHPLRSLYSDILPRPGTTVIFAEECSANVPPDLGTMQKGLYIGDQEMGDKLRNR